MHNLKRLSISFRAGLRPFAAACCASALLLLAPCVTAQVRIEDSENRVTISIDGKPFTALEKGAAAHKPYISPIFTASGKRITRGFPDDPQPGDPTDHPHQRGLWLGAEHLSGLNLWELDPADPHPGMGSIRFDKVVAIKNGEDTGALTIAATWLDPDYKPLLEETLTLTFHAHTGASRVMDIDMRLKAVKLATFEDARDGVIGIRLAPGFDEARGGKMVNAEGVAGAKPTEGKHSAWMDWQTTLEGETVGVTLMESPGNPHAPSTWITRGMGLMFSNPFAQRYYDKTRKDGSLSLQPGDELQLRYRLLLHPAGTDVAAAYKEYAAQ
jgi:hypothetical protein